MADYGLSTLGVRLFGAESTDGNKVTDASAYSEFTRINSIGEMALEANNIDASALIDVVTRYVAGRSDVSDTYTVTINVTNDTIAEWTAVLGKKICFVTYVPGLTSMVYVIATVPGKVPVPGFEQNSLLTVAINCTTNDFIGFDDPIEGLVDENTITIDKTTDTVDVGDTTTLTATTVPAGSTVTWTSSDTSVATVANGVVTGVSAGTAVITAKSGTATASCTVTVESV